MKIKKTQLQQIIFEEAHKLMQEFAITEPGGDTKPTMPPPEPTAAGDFDWPAEMPSAPTTPTPAPTAPTKATPAPAAGGGSPESDPGFVGPPASAAGDTFVGPPAPAGGAQDPTPTAKPAPTKRKRAARPSRRRGQRPARARRSRGRRVQRKGGKLPLRRGARATPDMPAPKRGSMRYKKRAQHARDRGRSAQERADYPAPKSTSQRYKKRRRVSRPRVSEHMLNIIQEEAHKLIQEGWPGKSGTLYHGIEWFDKQSTNQQRKIFERFRTGGGQIGTDGPEKKQWNNWLWKWEVPKKIKQGRD